MPEPVTITALTLVGKWVLTHIGVSSASTGTAIAVGAVTVTTATLAAAGLGFAIIDYLTHGKLIKWFRERRSTIEQKPEMVAFTKKAIMDGKHKVIQGIFDTETEEIKEGRVIDYDDIDPDLDEDFDEGDGTIIWKK